MKSVFNILLAVVIFSCKDSSVSSNKQTNDSAERKLSEQDLYMRAYDLADLKSLTSTSKFVGRFSITKRYNNTFFIEIDEIANGINLCVKQPVVYLPDFKEYDTLRSLPFNQICYWYADADAAAITRGFLKYNTGKTIRDIECINCLDPEVWTIEVYNKGQYSTTTKDYIRESDSVFINMLYDKVKLNEKNNYHIMYK